MSKFKELVERFNTSKKNEASFAIDDGDHPVFDDPRTLNKAALMIASWLNALGYQMMARMLKSNKEDVVAHAQFVLNALLGRVYMFEPSEKKIVHDPKAFDTYTSVKAKFITLGLVDRQVSKLQEMKWKQGAEKKVEDKKSNGWEVIEAP